MSPAGGTRRVRQRRAWRLAGEVRQATWLRRASRRRWGAAYTSFSVQLGQEEQVPADLERERLGLGLVHAAAHKARREEGGEGVAPLLEEDGEDDVLLLHLLQLRQRLPWPQLRLHFLHMEKEVLRSGARMREFGLPPRPPARHPFAAGASLAFMLSFM